MLLKILKLQQIVTNVSFHRLAALILASLLFNRFMKGARIGLLQLNIIYEGQLTSASVLSTLSTNDFDTLLGWLAMEF